MSDGNIAVVALVVSIFILYVAIPDYATHRKDKKKKKVKMRAGLTLIQTIIFLGVIFGMFYGMHYLLNKSEWAIERKANEAKTHIEHKQ